MHRLIVVMLVLVLALPSLTAVALADEAALPPGCKQHTYGVLCDGKQPGRRPTAPSDPTTPVTTYPFVELWRPILSSDANGTCIDSETVRLGRDPTVAELQISEMQFARWVRQYPICATLTPPPVTTPEIEAASFVRRIGYPTPEPYVQPGRLPVGFEAFLELGAPTSQDNGPHATPFGPLVVTSSAEIYVDWDDPHDDVEGEEGPYEVVIDTETGRTRPARPGPHPDGEITHLYQNDGFYEIQVRLVWTADWQIGTGHSGTIPGIETTGTYPAPGFEAYSRQAVG